MSVRGASTSYALYDGHGNISALTNGTGTVTDTYTYDPYGRQSHPTGSSTQPFGYNAGYTTNGLVHYGARLDNPTLGRWTQEDPLNLPSDLVNGNRYVYVGGDPANLEDPTGLISLGGVVESARTSLENAAADAGNAVNNAVNRVGKAIAVCGAGVVISRVAGPLTPRGAVVGCGAAVAGVP